MSAEELHRAALRRWGRRKWANCECGHERGYHGDCTGPCRRNDCTCRGFSPKRPTERSDSRLSLRQHDADFTKRQPSEIHAESACTDDEVTKSEKEGSINCVHEIDPKRPRAEAGESLLGEGANDPSDASASDASGVRGDARSDPPDAVGRHDADEVAVAPPFSDGELRAWRDAPSNTASADPYACTCGPGGWTPSCPRHFARR